MNETFYPSAFRTQLINLLLMIEPVFIFFVYAQVTTI